MSWPRWPRLRRTDLLLPVTVVAGAVAIGVAAYNAFVMPLTEPRLETEAGPLVAAPLWAWARSLSALVPYPSGILTAAVVVSILAFLAYGLAVAITWRRSATRLRLALIVGVAVVAFGLTALALPTLDSDIFSYVADGRVAAVHGANPEIVAPAAYPDDPIVRYASPLYRGVVGDNKLPLWTDITALLARAGGDDPVANLLLYRAVFLTANLLNLALVALILRRLRPDLLLAGLALYGWNPIVISTGQSKVDTLMATFVLLSVLGIVGGRHRRATVALVLSVLVKLITLPLLVIQLGGGAWGRRWRELALDLWLVAAVSVAVYATFWAGPGELHSHLGLLTGGGSSTPSALRPLVLLGFVGVVLWSIHQSDGSPHGTIRGWTITMLYFGALLTTPGLSWYLIALIALVAVAGDALLAVGGIAVSAVSFLFDRAQRFELSSPVRVDGRILFIVAGIGVLAAVAMAVWIRRRPERSPT